MSFLSALAATLALSCPASGQTTRYVDDDTCPDPGTGSLVDPYCSIQVAILASSHGDTVEVAPGTYFEAIDFLGMAITLRSSDGAASTIIDATGVPDLGNGISVVHCVNGETATTVLDGFTLTGGTGDTTRGIPSGGGMFNDDSSPTVTNCVFSGNTTGVGGGMYNSRSSPTVTNCTFSGNTASHGGGMYNDTSSNPTVTNCTFSGNTISGVGGGMRNSSSSPTLTNCTFSGNTTRRFGGGIYNDVSSLTVTDCTFIGNTASDDGGGMYNFRSNPTLTNCTFSGNTADFGSGMSNNASTPTVINCTFSNNMAGSDGGGMYNFSSSSPTVTNCTFNGNTANFSGGGIFNSGGSPTLTNCTFSGNTADNGGGLFNESSSSPTLTNCILWSNIPNEIFNNTSTPTIAYSDVGGSGGSAAWNPLLGLDGGGNIDANPLFVDPLGLDGLAGTDDDDLHLLPGSPAINAGHDAAIPLGVTTDLDGLPRVVCGVDMGVYEYQSPPMPVHNITTNTFYCTIQDCIDEAADTQECVVPPGTYFEAINFSGKAITLRSSDGPASTIIDATNVPVLGNTVSVVRCISGETATTVLDGFTITGGTGDTVAFGFSVGGGMFNDGSSPTVTNCTFSGNRAGIHGGGMYNVNASSPTITNCTFTWNTAERGGGMSNGGSSPTLTNCTFSDNTAHFNGGGMNNNVSSPTLTNCTFSGNTTSGDGGGMNNIHASSPTVTNCTISGNTAGHDGGGMYNFNTSSPTVTNCTFSGNTSGSGGGMLNNFSSNPTLTNCILWGDSPDEIINFDTPSTPIIAYSDVGGSGGSAAWNASLGLDGGGNIDANPLFVNPQGLDALPGTADDDLHLLPGSPCIDAADYDAYLSAGGGPADLDGKTRAIDNISAMDTGVGILSYLDMGAFEFLEGDCHVDGIVGLGDFANLQTCLGGPDPEPNPGCTCVDLNFDDHVDLRDFAQFQLNFSP